MKKLSQFSEVYISEIPGVIWLKFGMWGTDGGGYLHSKNRPVLYKQHEAKYAQKLQYRSSSHGCGAPASWATLPCLL